MLHIIVSLLSFANDHFDQKLYFRPKSVYNFKQFYSLLRLYESMQAVVKTRIIEESVSYEISYNIYRSPTNMTKGDVLNGIMESCYCWLYYKLR